jgi:hypothetical protein
MPLSFISAHCVPLSGIYVHICGDRGSISMCLVDADGYARGYAESIEAIP